MRSIGLSSLRARLTTLVILAILPALGFMIYSAVEQRKLLAAEVQKSALRLARLASTNQERLIEGARQLLVTLSQLEEVQGGDAITCSALLHRLLQQHPLYANFGVIDPVGLLVCSALPSQPGLDLSDRLYFRRARETRAFAVGEYQIGRVTNKATLNFGYPVLDDARNVRRVVFAALDLAWINDLAAKAQLPAGSTLTVVDRRGTILARYPDPEQWVGKSAPEAAIVAAILDQGEGVADAAGLDGVRRLYGFAPLYGTPQVGGVYVSIGVPRDAAFATVDRIHARNIVGLLLVGIVALVASRTMGDRFVLKPVAALLAVTERLSAGDLTARAPLAEEPAELNRLAHAFNQMASSLAGREAQLREAEARYRTLVEQSLVGVYLTTADRLLYTNEALLRIFGYQAHEVIGVLTPADLVHPDDRSLVARNILDRLKGDVEFLQYTARGVRKDGTPIHCEVFGRRIEYNGQPAVLGTLIDITERKQAEAQVQRQLEHLSALRTTDLAITASLDLRVTLNVFLDQVTSQLKVDAANILLFNSGTQSLQSAVNRGFHTKALQRADLRIGQGYAGQAALDRRVVHIPDLPAALGEFARSPELRKEGFVAYYAIPLTAKGEVKGVLEIFHRAPLTADPEWLAFLEALAGQATIAIDNAALFTDLQRVNVDLTLAYDTTLEGWSRALDLRDKETEGHTQRVAELTLRLARVLGVRDEDLVHIRRGALLHDMGKMGIPDAILLKPGPLTEEEWEIMRKHPIHAYELLSPISFLRPALDIPYYHHEKWDGTGYPRGLKGEAIPLAARIFAVVDVRDALTSDRPYRPARPHDRTLAHIREQAGKHFDPHVVARFLELNL